MDRKELRATYIAFCQAANLKPEQVILSAGGAMVMFGSRETTQDLDVDVPREFYDLVKTESNVRRSSLGEYVDFTDVVSLHVLDPNVDHDVAIFLDDEDGKDVYTYGIMSMLEQKLRLLEMTDRKPEKIPQDLIDLDKLVLGATLAGKASRDLLQRATAAKAKYL